MLASHPLEHFPGRPRSTRLDVRESSLERLDRLDAIEKLLVGLGILNDDLGAAVDGEHEGMTGLLHSIEQFGRPARAVDREVAIGGQQVLQDPASDTA